MSKHVFDFKTATVADIGKAIASIKTRAKGIDAEVQQVGLAAIKQVIDHNNTTPLNDLYKALSVGMRSTAFAVWAAKHGGVAINKDKKGRKVLPLVLADKPADLAAAMAEQWTAAKTEASLGDIVDSQKAIKTLMARLLKAEKVSDKAVVDRLVAAFPELAKGNKTASNGATVPHAVPALPVGLPNQAAAMH